MVKAKLSASGSEMMTNPFSGKPFENLIFMGPIYYQRLRHLVDDKIFYRTRGMINALTRQPLKGRTRDGGLRFGEMERDCILSHGLTEVLKERLFTVSDYFVVNVCGKCGILVNRTSDLGKPSCHSCRQVPTPFNTERKDIRGATSIRNQIADARADERPHPSQTEAHREIVINILNIIYQQYN